MGHPRNPADNIGRDVINEPRLPVELEDGAEPETAWSAKAMRELARQLTVSNDFYFPLLGVARHLELEQSK